MASLNSGKSQKSKSPTQCPPYDHRGFPKYGWFSETSPERMISYTENPPSSARSQRHDAIAKSHPDAIFSSNSHSTSKLPIYHDDNQADNYSYVGVGTLASGFNTASRDLMVSMNHQVSSTMNSNLIHMRNLGIGSQTMHPEADSYTNEGLYSDANTQPVYSNVEVNTTKNIECFPSSEKLLNSSFRANETSNYGSWSGKLYSNQESRGASSASQSVLEGMNIVELAKQRDGSQYLQFLVQKGNPHTRQKIFYGVIHSIPELMTDHYGHHLFRKLIESCDSNQLKQIIEQIALQPELVLAEALDKHGSQSFQKLIKQLKSKKSLGAFTLTSILADRFYELATHKIGRHIIFECLNSLGNQPNKVLLEEAIKLCDKLSIHEFGCLFLSKCISLATGDQRDRLLHRITELSRYLSNDRYGNYVVQEVLNLHNPVIMDKICDNLQGNYVHLSQQRGGSHIVEKCIQFSGKGMEYAVEEITKSKKALTRLAQDEFGNYVIRTALLTTEQKGSKLYKALVNDLKQNLPYLEGSNYGKNVAALIRDARP